MPHVELIVYRNISPRICPAVKLPMFLQKRLTCVEYEPAHRNRRARLEELRTRDGGLLLPTHSDAMPKRDNRPGTEGWQIRGWRTTMLQLARPWLRHQPDFGAQPLVPWLRRTRWQSVSQDDDTALARSRDPAWSAGLPQTAPDENKAPNSSTGTGIELGGSATLQLGRSDA